MTSRTAQLLFLSTVLTTSMASMNLPQHHHANNHHASSAFSISNTSRQQQRQRKQQLLSEERFLTNNKIGQSTTTAFIEPVVSAMSTIGAFYQNQPYAAAFVTSTVKGVAADFVVAQRRSTSSRQQQPGLQQSTSSNSATSSNYRPTWNNNMMVTLLYSGIYQGMAMEYVYNTVFPKLFGASILLKVLVSMFVVSPFFGFPLAYLIKAGVFRHHSAMNAMRQYWQDVRHEGLLQTYWMVWIPFQTAAFAVVPQHLRTSFITAVSFCWMVIFSSMSSAKTKQQ